MKKKNIMTFCHHDGSGIVGKEPRYLMLLPPGSFPKQHQRHRCLQLAAHSTMT
jgi:hypothetical protein